MRKVLVSFLFLMGFLTQITALTNPARQTRSNHTYKGNHNITRANNSLKRARSVIKQKSNRRNESGVIINSVKSRDKKIHRTTKINKSRNAVNLNKSSASKIARTVKNKTALKSSIIPSYTFKKGYTPCRDSYFTCMDQFCGKSDYKRCNCSIRLDSIQNKEVLLKQTYDRLEDFKDLNIDVISKYKNEVKAMLSESEGERGIKEDNSDSANKLSGISAVLNRSKNNHLSSKTKSNMTQDINSLWSENDFKGSSEIANLKGEQLYSTVNEQCSSLVYNSCGSDVILKMITSAYSMYIENDCNTISSELEKKIKKAEESIRKMESLMKSKRLENYNNHNKTAINECTKKVHEDLTADSACGKNFVHCLDYTGLYLNKSTGEPIYTIDFYKLKHQISLDGNIIQNETNKHIINQLNSKKMFAKKTLDTCRDLSEEVWKEFLNQTIVYIKQKQDEIIKNIEKECLNVINTCYDEKVKSLKDFSNLDEGQLLKYRLNTASKMCTEKLDTCKYVYFSNLEPPSETDKKNQEYLKEQLDNIKQNKIFSQCSKMISEYLLKLCTPVSGLSNVNYPFPCATFKPGARLFDHQAYIKDSIGNIDKNFGPQLFKECKIKYTSCKKGYIMVKKAGNQIEPADDTDITNNDDITTFCIPVNRNSTKITQRDDKEYEIYENSGLQYYLTNLKGLKHLLDNISLRYNYDDTQSSKTHLKPTELLSAYDYIGSLYEDLIKFAVNNCYDSIYSSHYDFDNIPIQIKEEVNPIMDKLEKDMLKELSKQCESTTYDGIWTNVVITPNEGLKKYHKRFYDRTGTHKSWGTCLLKEDKDENKGEKK